MRNFGFIAQLLYVIGAGFAVPSLVAQTLPGTLWDNGPVITHAGQGPSGTNVSMASPVPNNTGVNITSTIWRADDFTVDAPGWFVSLIQTFAYDTGFSTPRWDAAIISIHRNEDGTPLVAQANASWQPADINRIFNGTSNLSNQDRQMHTLTADFGNLVITAGEYLFAVSILHSDDRNSWIPPVMDINATNANSPFTRRILLVALACLAAPTAFAEWRTESFPLKNGWNAIYPLIDCSHSPLEFQLDDYALNVRPSSLESNEQTLPIFELGTAFEIISQTNGAARMGDSAGFLADLSSQVPTNQTLILVTSGNFFWFLRIESVLDSHMAGNDRYADYFRDPTTHAATQVAYVGKRIPKPSAADSHAGWVDWSVGDAIDPTAYIDPFAEGFDLAESGAIIPVNASPTKRVGNENIANDQIAVWWFKRATPPADLAGRIAPIWFPTYNYRYQLQWPLDAPEIVLASRSGSGPLRSDIAVGHIYQQNNPALKGYNPNEEHALMIGGAAYAIRDDLNVPMSS